jgi:hypothetical protein
MDDSSNEKWSKQIDLAQDLSKHFNTLAAGVIAATVAIAAVSDWPGLILSLKILSMYLSWIFLVCCIFAGAASSTVLFQSLLKTPHLQYALNDKVLLLLRLQIYFLILGVLGIFGYVFLPR